MIPIDVYSDISYRVIEVKSMTKSGKITCFDGEVIHAPVSRVRKLINYYKASSFNTAIPMALLYICDQLLDVETFAYTSKQDVEVGEDGLSHYRYSDTWKPTMAFRIHELQKCAKKIYEKSGVSEWYCDGTDIYCLTNESVSIDGKGNWFLQGTQSVPVARLQLGSADMRELSPGYAIKYVSSCGSRSQSVCVGNTAVIQNALKNAKENRHISFDSINTKITPSLSFLMRAVTVWSEIFGDHVLEDLDVAKLLIHFGTCNLLTIPSEVRRACATGISYQGMLARSLGLCHHARSLEDASKLKGIVQSLLSDGYVWKDALTVNNIYRQGIQTVPEKADTSAILSQIEDVREDYLSRQV